MKAGRFIRLQRYLPNPPMTAAVWLGLVPGRLQDRSLLTVDVRLV